MRGQIRQRIGLGILLLFFIVLATGCASRTISPPPAPIENTPTGRAESTPSPVVEIAPSPVIGSTPSPVAPKPTPAAGLTTGDVGGAESGSQALAAVGEMIRKEVDAGFPGAVLLVAREGHVVYHEAYGYARKWNGGEAMADPQPMNKDTLFDLASMTKFFAASLAVMKLYDQGLIGLDDPVSDYLDGFCEGERATITIRMLMNHSAGFPASYCFYRQGDAGGVDTYSLDRTRTISLLPHVPLDYGPGTGHQYSDIGFITLGAVVESIAGTTLDEYVDQEIYGPLGLKHIAFNPLDHGFSQEQTAATETMGNTRGGLISFDGVRTGTLQGQAHDETAWYCLGGVSGHAGLFADAESLSVLCQMLLNGGSHGGVEIYSEQTLDTFLDVPEDTRYGLGFASAREYFGEYASKSAFCINGWTGTVMVVDPERSLIIILLTNKRHSPCIGGEFQSAEFKTGGYDAVVAGVYEALEGSDY